MARLRDFGYDMGRPLFSRVIVGAEGLWFYPSRNYTRLLELILGVVEAYHHPSNNEVGSQAR